MSDSSEPSGPLHGLRVIDLSAGPAGAFGARFLAGLGADVLRVEDEPAQALRYAPPRVSAPDPEGSALAHFLNGGKQSITADWTRPEDRDWIRSAVMSSDAVIEDRGSRGLSEMGLSVQALRQQAPHLVVTSISPYGQTEEERAWDDLTVSARGGLLHTTGSPSREPLLQGGQQTAYQAGAFAATATLVGLTSALRSGQGEHIDCSMAEAVAVMVDPNIYWNEVDPAKGGRWAAMSRRLGNRSPGPPRGLWPCRDGMVMAIPRLDRSAESLADLTGIEAFRDPKYQSLEGAAEHADELSALLISWLMDHDRVEVYRRAQEAGHYFGYLTTVDELADLPQLVARGFFTEVGHPVAGRLRYPGGPGVFSETPWVTRRAPLLDEHRGQRSSWSRPSGRERGSEPARPGRPLHGIRVLDLTRAWAGPLATKLFADLGADVVKVHAIQVANPQWSPTNSAYFRYLDGGKRTIGIDMASPDGAALVKSLAGEADVLVENFSPRVLRKFGLNHEALAEVNPRLVMVSMPGFGSSGPEQGYRALGETIEAISGLMSLTGYRDEPHPTKSGVNYGDPIAGVSASLVALAGLISRERTGRGQWVDLSHLEAAVNWLGEWVVAHSSTGALPARLGNGHRTYAPRGVYPVRGDDRWVALAVHDGAQLAALCEVLGGDWVFGSPHERVLAQDRLDREIAELTKAWDGAELVDALQARGVPAERVHTAPDVLDDEMLDRRGFWFDLVPQDSDVPAYRYNRSPLRIPGPGVPSTPAGFSEHLDAVLEDWLGMDPSDRERLVADGAISRVPLAAKRADLRL